jgi:transcriptional regulator with GAF, ATPase, and Fis domain
MEVVWENQSKMHYAYRKLESLLELPVLLNRQNDFQEILRVVCLKTSVLFTAEIVSIVMINPCTLDTIKTVMKAGREAHQHQYHFVQTNVIGWARKNNQPFLSPDVKSDLHFSKDLFEDLPVKSVMCVPIENQSAIIGYIIVINKNGKGEFDHYELGLLEKLAAISAPFLSNVQKLQEYFNAPLPETVLLAKYESFGLLGKSKPFIDMLSAIEAAAQCNVRVSLEGESGTGKELVACAIHKLSYRRECPFVAIDCGAVPDHLIESEFFGHVKGAFTSAAYDRKGLLEEAHRGTLFMDEINNLPLDMQAKFLRVLQEGEIRPIGSNKTQTIDVRIISASSAPLYQLVEEKQFREDLFYRLHVYPITIPSLNERKEDIPLLATKFLEKFAKQQAKKAASFSRECMNFMKHRHWTGNIRELENFVERLVTVASPDIEILDRNILPEELSQEFNKSRWTYDDSHVKKSLTENVAGYERQLIRQSLILNDWNQSKAARDLKMSVQTLRYKIKRLKIIEPVEK